MSMERAGRVEIGCLQVLENESLVRSEQWMVLPFTASSGITPEELFESYLRHIRRFTCTFVRPRRSSAGIEFRSLGFILLAFTQPRQEPGKLTLAITGGLLSQKGCRHVGELAFLCDRCRAGVRIAVCLLVILRPFSVPHRASCANVFTG